MHIGINPARSCRPIAKVFVRCAAWALPAVAPSLASADQQIIVTALAENMNASALDAGSVRRAGTPDLIGALARELPGVSLQDAQDNPYQPNLVYHGYVASPLQGTPQGLAVYLDGARFNQPFGETVNFDLLPDIAVASFEIADASPVYGLNALGGALLVATRDGRSVEGVHTSVALGDHKRSEADLEAGTTSGAWSFYGAVQFRHDDGWREHSPSTLGNLFADTGYDGDNAGVHVKLVAADSDLTGNGSSPVELLAADRRAVFTYPDTTRNRYGRVSLHPYATLSPSMRLSASLYLQHLRQRTVNGDAADIAACATLDSPLCLADDDGHETILKDPMGAAIPAANAPATIYGVLNRSKTATTAGGALVQLDERHSLLGGINRLTVGASYDKSATVFSAATELGSLNDAREVNGLGPIIALSDNSITPVALIARTAYTGVFISDALPLGTRLSATLAARFNIASIALNDRIGTNLNGRHRFARLNPAAAITYRFNDLISVSADYAETNRAPTPAELSCAGPQEPCSLANFFVGDPSLKQVVARTWQLRGSGQVVEGSWTFDWRASAYRATNHDDIQFIAADVRGRAFFRNIGETRRQGVELQLTGKYGGFRTSFGYAFIDATARTPLILDSPDNPSAADDGTIIVVRGDQLPGVPHHRAVLSLDYSGSTFTLGGDIQGQSSQFLFGDESNRQQPLNGFLTLNIRSSLHVGGSVWIFGNITNLFDDHHASYGTFSETSSVALVEAPGADNPRSVSPSAPRRFLAGIKGRF